MGTICPTGKVQGPSSPLHVPWASFLHPRTASVTAGIFTERLMLSVSRRLTSWLRKLKCKMMMPKVSQGENLMLSSRHLGVQ